ncbi:uncharacterized protein EI97DRAFT_460051 [Westerdykella ornata]|uniref:Uncharacterized protein n=1 Tax=Westerdykella ornata TaxID=318751 RepID=A0A6A6JE65_WESOR|nr:uncharacterized protein EI97DRAFT_460051 [Westerdykella ornata]KAF2274463.1 hypothetical protein EI97DRAFT_460051 [Westerdykella ornata]
MSHSYASRTASIRIPTQSQLGSPLLRLPLELQLMIYGFCLTMPTQIVDPGIPSHLSPCNETDGHQNPALPMLLVCEETYHAVHAAARCLYTNNSFHFTTIANLDSFLGHLPPHHSALLAHISISLDGILGWHPNQTDEWLQYLADDLAGGSKTTWSRVLDSLKTRTPNLKSLMLTLDRDGLISQLALDNRVMCVAQAMVKRVRGLGLEECVVVCPVAELRILWKGLEDQFHFDFEI